MTYLDLITDALRELNILDAEQEAQAADAAFLLRKLNRLFDSWNAKGAGAYALVNADYTLTPSLNPHTIGASGTFTATRPDAIEQAALVSGGVVYPLVLRSFDWWNTLTTPTLEATIPTDLAYRASYPNASLYLYPVPSSAVTLRLTTRTPLAAVTLATDVALPPGYQEALTLTLAEDCAENFGTAVSPRLALRAQVARATLFANHDRPRRLATVDAGMPGSMTGWAYDYQTGPFR